MSTTLRMIELVRGGVGDLDDVERVMAAAFDPRFGEAWTRGQCVGVLAMPGIALQLARVDGKVVGFALTRTIMDEAELLLLAIVPRHRRHGIATRLLRSVIADCEAGGMIALHLEVRGGNPASELYLANGFQKVGERHNYYRGANGQPFDAHSYSRRLTN